MNLKNRLESIFRGWFPKEPEIARTAETKNKASKPKPSWWKPFWIILVILSVVNGIIFLFIANAPPERAAIGLALTFLGIGFAYYIRVRPSIRINRAIYILIGITPIGFVLWVALIVGINYSGIRDPISNALGGVGFNVFMVALFVGCFAIGAYIGDWIGKRRNYLLPLTP